jgi:hypothetical protein
MLLGSADATHYLLGGDVALGDVLGVEATLFYSSSGELPVRHPLPCTGAEPFVLFDAEAEALVDCTEIIVASWYATAGELDEHRTGATDGAPGQAEDMWRAPPGPADVGMWVMLRDGRGGVGYAAYRFAVE